MGAGGGVQEEHRKRACTFTSVPSPVTAVSGDGTGLPFLAQAGRHTLQVATSLANVNDLSQRDSCCLDYPGSHT